LGARILTIADAYEAMTSSRPYRKIPLTHEQAVEQLERFAGIQFDPDIVPILVNLDRSILDREPEREDELKTMREQPDLEVEPDAEATAAASVTDAKDAAKSRPALASDDVS
ncbi:MAG TPA: HD domain-containing phosphohydrolase, partial [Patescibacteria group bacterium]|nr:HD domain-containing phosphohydrolase [Patescibacteria group bacterium]